MSEICDRVGVAAPDNVCTRSSPAGAVSSVLDTGRRRPEVGRELNFFLAPMRVEVTAIAYRFW